MSGDLGLTLVTIGTFLVFVITPLREAGLPGRIFFDLVVVVLMVSGALVVEQSLVSKLFLVGAVLVSAFVLGAGRLHPTPFLHQFGSVLTTATLLLYIRIVLLVMFRAGPMNWSRIQGGVCAYLLLGMAWASAFQFVEQLHPGSFRFVNAPVGMDQLTSKFTYYSFTTLTTLGSDISPRESYRALAHNCRVLCWPAFPCDFYRCFGGDGHAVAPEVLICGGKTSQSSCEKSGNANERWGCNRTDDEVTG